MIVKERRETDDWRFSTGCLVKTVQLSKLFFGDGGWLTDVNRSSRSPSRMIPTNLPRTFYVIFLDKNLSRYWFAWYINIYIYLHKKTFVRKFIAILEREKYPISISWRRRRASFLGRRKEGGREALNRWGFVAARIHRGGTGDNHVARPNSKLNRRRSRASKHSHFFRFSSGSWWRSRIRRLRPYVQVVRRSLNERQRKIVRLSTIDLSRQSSNALEHCCCLDRFARVK